MYTQRAGTRPAPTSHYTGVFFDGEYEIAYTDSMKNLQDIQLKIVPILKQSDVVRSFVFGSYARNEATAASDLDVLVEFGTRKSLLDIIHIKHRLEDETGIDVDILTPEAIHPSLQKYIDRDKIQIV